LDTKRQGRIKLALLNGCSVVARLVDYNGVCLASIVEGKSEGDGIWARGQTYKLT
jgi:hypothetical protein